MPNLKLIILISFFLFVSLHSEAQRKNIKKPKNIIFLVGDGIGLSQISAELVYRGGDLNRARFKRIGFIRTQISDNFIMDSAAGSTAFSIGKKTYNGSIGLDSLKKARPTIVEIAEKHGLTTSLVVTCHATHSNSASFIEHQPSRKMNRKIAYDFTQTDINAVTGGGGYHFGKLSDGMNLKDTLFSNRYYVSDNTVDFLGITASEFYELTNNFDVSSMKNGRGTYSEKASIKAIDLLSKNKKGFFLMVEGSPIDLGEDMIMKRII